MREHTGSIGVHCEHERESVARKELVTLVYMSSKGGCRTTQGEPCYGTGARKASACPGHIITPMVKTKFEEDSPLKETWEKDNMLGETRDIGGV